ncbi:TonB family protein [Hymenobacter algoricola]
MPRFQAADSTTASVLQYISRGVRYPKEALQAGASGTVFVTFVVSKQGMVEQAKVIRGVQQALDQEALRLIQTMPAWQQPGRQGGQPVAVQYTVPVRFNMQRGLGSVLAAPSAREEAAAGNKPAVFTHDPLGVVHYLQGATQGVKAPKGGVVTVSFTVQTDGKVGAAQIVSGLAPEADAAVLQAVQHMPAWKPGMQQGQPVAVPFTRVPVRINSN